MQTLEHLEALIQDFSAGSDWNHMLVVDGLLQDISQSAIAAAAPVLVTDAKRAATLRATYKAVSNWVLLKDEAYEIRTQTPEQVATSLEAAVTHCHVRADYFEAKCHKASAAGRFRDADMWNRERAFWEGRCAAIQYEAQARLG